MKKKRTKRSSKMTYLKNEGLKLETQWKKYIESVQKIIDSTKEPEEKAVVKGSRSEFLELMVKLWETGMLKVPGNNTFSALGHFLHSRYYIWKIDSPGEELGLTSLMTELYKFKKL